MTLVAAAAAAATAGAGQTDRQTDIRNDALRGSRIRHPE